MNKGIWLAAALFAGSLLGSGLQGVVGALLAPRAQAQSVQHQFKVVGGSYRAQGYEDDLNKYTAEGWRYVGSIPDTGKANAGGYLVFEKP